MLRVDLASRDPSSQIQKIYRERPKKATSQRSSPAKAELLPRVLGVVIGEATRRLRDMIREDAPAMISGKARVRNDHEEAGKIEKAARKNAKK